MVMMTSVDWPHHHVSETVPGGVQELSLRHISSILRTFAILCYLPDGMMRRFVAEVERRLASEPFGGQELSNLLWALTISQVVCPTPSLLPTDQLAVTHGCTHLASNSRELVSSGALAHCRRRRRVRHSLPLPGPLSSELRVTVKTRASRDHVLPMSFKILTKTVALNPPGAMLFEHAQSGPLPGSLTEGMEGCFAALHRGGVERGYGPGGAATGEHGRTTG